MECLLHIAYRLDFKQWAARSNEHKEMLQNRKKNIQNKFKEELNLLIDIVKQGSGTTNDGNTARKFFEFPNKTAAITGLDQDLIKRFSVILQAIPSGEKIDRSSNLKILLAKQQKSTWTYTTGTTCHQPYINY